MADPILKAVNRLTHAVLMRLTDQANGLPEDESRLAQIIDAAERLADEHRDHLDAHELLAKREGDVLYLKDALEAREQQLVAYQQKFGVL